MKYPAHSLMPTKFISGSSRSQSSRPGSPTAPLVASLVNRHDRRGLEHMGARDCLAADTLFPSTKLPSVSG
jgi:hypothetical protein